MDRIRDSEFVAVIDDDPVALIHDERRTRHDAVIRLRHHRHARLEGPGRFAADDVKDFRAAVHFGYGGERAVGAGGQLRFPGRGRYDRDRSAQQLHPDGAHSGGCRRFVCIGQRRPGQQPEEEHDE